MNHTRVEQKLAIMMWQHIKEHIEEPGFKLELFKAHFCELYGLNWKSNCWLCEQFKCVDCPLHTCIDWDDVIENSVPYVRATFLHDKSACDEIIEAIRSVEV